MIARSAPSPTRPVQSNAAADYPADCSWPLEHRGRLLFQEAQELWSLGYQRAAVAICRTAVEVHLAAICLRHPRIASNKEHMRLLEAREALFRAGVIDKRTARLLAKFSWAAGNVVHGHAVRSESAAGLLAVARTIVCLWDVPRGPAVAAAIEPRAKHATKGRRAWLSLLARVQSPRVQAACHGAIEAAAGLIDAGCHREAQTIVEALAVVLLRWRFLLDAGRGSGPVFSLPAYLQRLASAGGDDAGTFLAALDEIEGPGSDELHARRLLALVQWLRERIETADVFAEHIPGQSAGELGTAGHAQHSRREAFEQGTKV